MQVMKERKNEKARILELAKKLSRSRDPAEREKLKQALARLIFGQ